MVLQFPDILGDSIYIYRKNNDPITKPKPEVIKTLTKLTCVLESTSRPAISATFFFEEGVQAPDITFFSSLSK
jgi:hypothetical protein